MSVQNIEGGSLDQSDSPPFLVGESYIRKDMDFQTWKRLKKKHKRNFSPKKLAQKTRKSVNIQIRDKIA